MADSNLNSSIDRFFDRIDAAVDGADRILNRSKYAEEKLRGTRTRRANIDTAPPVRTRKTPPSTSTAIVAQRFRIVESIDATSGIPVFVVTDGGAARVECTTRELALKILRALETSP